MENGGVGLAEIDMVGRDQVVRPGAVEEGPLAGRLHRHHVGEGGGGVPGEVDLPAVDPPLVAKADEEAAVLVVADERHRLDRKLGAEALQIDRGIGAVAAALALLGDDDGDGLLVGPVVDQLVAVDAPGDAAENPPP